MRVSALALVVALCLSSAALQVADAAFVASPVVPSTAAGSSSFATRIGTISATRQHQPPTLWCRRHSHIARRSHCRHPSLLRHEAAPRDLHEFDSILQEGGGVTAAGGDRVVQSALLKTTTRTQGNHIQHGRAQRHRVLLPGLPPSSSQERDNVNTNYDHQTVIQMTSSIVTTPEEAVEQTDESTMAGADADDEYDYAEQLNKIQQYDDQRASPKFNLNEYVKNADFGDLVVTLAVPSIIAYVGFRFASNKVTTYLETKADTTLDSFSKEMLYHDGDFEEMKLCKDEYSRKLTWMGPKRNNAMLKRYLEMYSKKKTVSPQSISSLSYVFSLFNLSEQQAADLLVALCKQMGPDKISSSGKLLFFGSRILKSPPAKAALSPIKDLIKSTYRDEEVAETLVETSQIAIAEAAYRAAVQAGGKDQRTLTVGWEVLGLDKDTATRIFEEEADEGFKTYRETMYSGQTTKYDKKGNVIDKDGNLADPDNAEGADDGDEEEDGSSTGVYECGNCGYTLFVAKGRDFKFFGDDFECPECGAKKDQFTSRDLDEE